MRAIREIIVHCSATPEGRHFTVADIDRWHRERGWSGIGYHYVIYLDGTIHEGRPVAKVGAHVAGRNSGTIGVCYIGGVEAGGRPKDTRTAAQRKALDTLLTDLVRTHAGVVKISGHRDYANKACPSFDATSEYRNLIATARGTAPAARTVKRALANEDGEAYRVSTRTANFREGPGGAVKSSLPKNVRVTATGQVAGGWIEVRTPNGHVGWIHESVLTPAAVTESLGSSRTIKGAGMAGMGGLGIVGDGAVQLAGDLQEAEYHFSAGSFLQLAIGALIIAGALWALYARWEDAGRPWPGKARG